MSNLARAAANDPEFSDPVIVLFIDGFSASVFSSFQYRDEIEEVIRTPQFMLKEYVESGVLSGDCDDIATFLAAILCVFGVPVRLRAIRYTAKQPEFEHVFVEAINEIGEWQILDPTVPPDTKMKYIESMVEPV